MEPERNIIYSFKHESIRTLIRKIEEIEGIDDECPEDFLPSVEKVLSEYDRSYKPVYRKIWAKEKFIKRQNYWHAAQDLTLRSRRTLTVS